MKISMFSSDPEIIQTLGPSKIRIASESNLIKALTSRLFCYDETGEIIPEIVSKFSWKQNTLILSIKDNFKSSQGDLLKTSDVYYTFMRNIVLDQGTHGNLKDILCPKAVINSIHDICDNLKFDDSQIYLTVETHQRKNLLELLTCMESSILMFSSFDHKTLAIKSWLNTTGTYFTDGIVNKLQDRVVLTLKKNKYHYRHINKKTADIIDLTAPVNMEQIESFQKGIVDVIPTYASREMSKLEAMRNNENVNVYSTQPIYLNYLQFFKNAMKKHSLEKRWVFGLAYRDFANKYFDNDKIYRPAIEYAPSFSNMSLTPEQHSQIVKDIEAIDKKKIDNEHGDGIVLALHEKISQKYKHAVKKRFPKLVLKEIPDFNLYDDSLNIQGIDCIVLFIDTFFTADYQSINYMVQSRILFPDITRGEEFMQKFREEQDNGVRNAMVQNAHYDMLKNMSTVPLVIYPYYAMARKPWTFKMNGTFAGTPFWLIEHE